MERFRPILMTTLAALLGSVPFVIATGPARRLRRPLGMTIIGGLIVSQVLTLYTTPVIYLLLDRLHRRLGGRGPQTAETSCSRRNRASIAAPFSVRRHRQRCADAVIAAATDAAPIRTAICDDRTCC